ncbi:MAG TPA: hypothetical protein VF284_09465 [Rhodanobacteraceae bacterium]
MNAHAWAMTLRRRTARHRRPGWMTRAVALVVVIAGIIAMALHAHDPQRAALGVIALVALLAALA